MVLQFGVHDPAVFVVGLRAPTVERGHLGREESILELRISCEPVQLHHQAIGGRGPELALRDMRAEAFHVKAVPLQVCQRWTAGVPNDRREVARDVRVVVLFRRVVVILLVVIVELLRLVDVPVPSKHVIIC